MNTVDTAAVRLRSMHGPTLVAELCDALDEARADNVHWRTTANVATNNVADWIAACEKAEADLARVMHLIETSYSLRQVHDALASGRTAVAGEAAP